jgi:four helix bundle protein
MESDISTGTSEGYHKLDIYTRSRSLALRIHELTVRLPKFETMEEGGQIRRSAKSITNNIVEGYALRKHKNEFLKYLHYAYGSCEETIQHLDFLFYSKSFKDEQLFQELHNEYSVLSKMIFRFIQSVSMNHEKPYYIKEEIGFYDAGETSETPIVNPQSLIPNGLAGRTILITRSADQSLEFRCLLESHGASTVCFPTIQIEDPESWQECDNTIWKLSEYQDVCFTSKNAVAKFVERIRVIRPQAVDILATRNIFAVGEKTRGALESSGFSVVASPKKSSAAELATTLQSHQIKGARILFPKSQIAREELPTQLRNMGAVVDELVVYRTTIPEPENLEKVRQLLSKKKIDVVTFFSPSSVVNFSELMGTDSLTSACIAAIGQTTAEAIDQVGLHTSIIAQQATAEGMVAAIETYFRNENI